jgi:hypothetical protein
MREVLHSHAMTAVNGVHVIEQRYQIVVPRPHPFPLRNHNIHLSFTIKYILNPSLLSRSSSPVPSPSSPSYPPTPTTPLLPNLPTTPLFNSNLLSISLASIPFSSRSSSTFRIVTTSKNCLPSPPFPNRANSLSASSASRYLAVNKLTAGFCLPIPPALPPPPLPPPLSRGNILCCGELALGTKLPLKLGS